ncbi:MAG: hypothetical protein ABFD97_04290 [Syntrophobacter sp.]
MSEIHVDLALDGEGDASPAISALKNTRYAQPIEVFFRANVIDS